MVIKINKNNGKVSIHITYIRLPSIYDQMLINKKRKSKKKFDRSLGVDRPTH